MAKVKYLGGGIHTHHGAQKGNIYVFGQGASPTEVKDIDDLFKFATSGGFNIVEYDNSTEKKKIENLIKDREKAHLAKKGKPKGEKKEEKEEKDKDSPMTIKESKGK